MKPSWKIRRRYIFAAFALGALMLLSGSVAVLLNNDSATSDLITGGVALVTLSRLSSSAPLMRPVTSTVAGLYYFPSHLYIVTLVTPHFFASALTSAPVAYSVFTRAFSWCVTFSSRSSCHSLRSASCGRVKTSRS
jgi:hypothetical protein